MRKHAKVSPAALRAMLDGAQAEERSKQERLARYRVMESLTDEAILAAIKGTDAGMRLAAMLDGSVRISDFQATLIACVRAVIEAGLAEPPK